MIHHRHIIIQDYIISKLSNHFKSYRFISEEIPQQEHDISKPTWILDPIDGTGNFYRGLPDFTISLALAFDQKIHFGVIYAPILNKLYYVERGKGAFVNDKKIHVSNVPTLRDSLLFLSSYNTFVSNKKEKAYNNLVKSIQNNKISRSTALDLCFVAEGCAEGRVLANTKIWDYAAGCLLIEEAAGRVTRWNNSTNYFGCSTIIATNGLIHDELLSKLNETK